MKNGKKNDNYYDDNIIILKMEANKVFAALALCYLASHYISLPSLITGFFTGNLLTIVVASIFFFELFKYFVKKYLTFDKRGKLLIEYLTKCMYSYCLTPYLRTPQGQTWYTIFTTLTEQKQMSNSTTASSTEQRPTNDQRSNPNEQIKQETITTPLATNQEKREIISDEINKDLKHLIKYLSCPDLTTDKLKSLLGILLNREVTVEETKNINDRLKRLFSLTNEENIIYEFLLSLK